MNSTKSLSTGSEAEKHRLIGNSLALDYGNTLYGHSGTPIHEYLYNYRDLVVWSQKAGILDARQAQVLMSKADKRPGAAASVFRRAIALRETIFFVFDAFAEGRTPSRRHLALLNQARREALSHSIIRETGRGFAEDWDEPDSLERMLWVIAIDAGALLTSPQLARVRQCRGEMCDWLFVDTSRNHMRRWCQMSVCGNRSKVRRFLRRKGRRPLKQVARDSGSLPEAGSK